MDTAGYSQNELVSNFPQLYKELVTSLPHLATHNYTCENSDYSDQLNECKNAYLCFNGYGLEDCFYLRDSRWNKDCADLSYSNKSELCYECVDCSDCYNCNFCRDCENSRDLWHCYDCFSCSDCFGCVGLQRKEFYIFNQKYSKEEYRSMLPEVRKMTLNEMNQKVEALRAHYPHRATHERQSENCFGEYIYESKNSFYVFKSYDIEDSSYIYDARKIKDSVDIGSTHMSELMYDSIEATGNYNCNFLYWCANCRDSEYVMYCFDCEACFGGFNLKRAKYRILNQPYEKGEYFKLVSAIKDKLKKKKRYYNLLPEAMGEVINMPFP